VPFLGKFAKSRLSNGKNGDLSTGEECVYQRQPQNDEKFKPKVDHSAQNPILRITKRGNIRITSITHAQMPGA
jgi:hypothetical protein